MFPRALVAATILLGACATPATAPSATVEPLTFPSAEPAPTERFDALDIRLELESSTVAAGAELAGELIAVNRSGEKVVDPGCWLAASRSAIVPPDDPGAELWLHVVVDCAGPSTIHPGDERRDALTFVAATKTGDPLPPGDYVAAVEYRGLSRRLEAPVEVTG
jgi:hypothetical protein